jgi:hypothetical protein
MVEFSDTAGGDLSADARDREGAAYWSARVHKLGHVDLTDACTIFFPFLF